MSPFVFAVLVIPSFNVMSDQFLGCTQFGGSSFCLNFNKFPDTSPLMLLLYMYVPALTLFFFYFLVYDHLMELSEKEGVLFLGKNIFTFEPPLIGTLRRQTGRIWHNRQYPY